MVIQDSEICFNNEYINFENHVTRAITYILLLLLLLLILLTAIGLSPGGSGCFTCTQI